MLRIKELSINGIKAPPGEWDYVKNIPGSIHNINDLADCVHEDQRQAFLDASAKEHRQNALTRRISQSK